MKDIDASFGPDVERMGIAAAQLVFARWGWMFREQPIGDFGIDAHVEPRVAKDRLSGRLIALQFKSGRSYLERAEGGWLYRGDYKHVRYWLGHVLPVVIMFYEPDGGVLRWQRIADEFVRYTEKAWTLFIPDGQILGPHAEEALRTIAEQPGGGVDGSVDAALELLPPTTAQTLRAVRTAQPNGVARLAGLLAQGRYEPRLTAQSVLNGRPSWLAEGDGTLEAALGAYANDHGHRDLARQAFIRAAEHGGVDSGRLYAVAALMAAADNQMEQAGALYECAEGAGASDLLSAVARAVVTSSDQERDAAIDEVLAAASAEQLAKDPTCLIVLGEQAGRRGDIAASIEHFEAALRVRPQLYAASLGLARALLARAVSGSSAVPRVDLRRAGQLARDARDNMRRWAGPSEQALVVVLSVLLNDNAHQAMLAAATPESLGGTATEREASFGPIAVLGAEAAAALRDRALALRLAELTSDAKSKRFIAAVAADPDLPVAERITLWRDALYAAPRLEQQRRALYQLAALGDRDLEDLVSQHVTDLDQEARSVLLARRDAALGGTDAAVLVLRGLAPSNSSAGEILIEVLERAGRIAEALTECDRAIERFGSSKISIDRLNILVRDGRLQEAEAYAMELLAGQDLDPGQRLTLRRALIGQNGRGGRLEAVVRHCEQALAEFPDTVDVAWHLIGALFQLGRAEQAQAAFQRLAPPVQRPVEAWIWLLLHRRYGFAEQDVLTALGWLTQWADDDAITTEILAVLGDAGNAVRPDGEAVLPEVSESTRAAFQAAVTRYIAEHPHGPFAVLDLNSTDLPAALRSAPIAAVSRPLTPTREVDSIAAQVRSGALPLRALARATARPYAQVLVETGREFLHADAADPDARARELAAAATALNSEVVVDSSVLTVALMLPERWLQLRSAFSTVRLPAEAIADIEAARANLWRIPGTSFAVHYDEEQALLVRDELSPAQHSALRHAIDELETAARSVTTTAMTAPLEHEPPQRPWYAPVELAAARGLALWCDDAAVRTTAHARELPVFGTEALLLALVQAKLLPDTLAEDRRLLKG